MHYFELDLTVFALHEVLGRGIAMREEEDSGVGSEGEGEKRRDFEFIHSEVNLGIDLESDDYRTG